MADDKGSKYRGPMFSVGLELTEPEKTSTGWRFTAIAPTEHRPTRTPPDPSREIGFLLDGTLYGITTTDPDTGYATLDIEVDRARPWKVQAQMMGTSHHSPVRAPSIREEKPKGAAKIRLHKNRRSGAFLNMLVQVLTDDDKPVTGVKVHVSDERELDGYRTIGPTDEQGSVIDKVHLRLRGKPRRIHYLVPGTPAHNWRTVR